MIVRCWIVVSVVWSVGCELVVCLLLCFFFQAEDGIRDLVRSRGLGYVYKRQADDSGVQPHGVGQVDHHEEGDERVNDVAADISRACLLYTSDAADDLLCVDLGGRRIIKKKKKQENNTDHYLPTPCVN